MDTDVSYAHICKLHPVSSNINGLLVTRIVCRCSNVHFLPCQELNFILCYFLLLLSNDLEVVVYEGVVREKPSNKEEARQFLKGLLNSLLPPCPLFFQFPIVFLFNNLGNFINMDCRLFWGPRSNCGISARDKS